MLARGVQAIRKGSKATAYDRFSGPSDQPTQKCEVVLGEKHQPEDLLLHHEVPDRSSRVTGARYAGTALLERLCAQSVLSVTQVQPPPVCKGRPHPGRAGGEHTVEDVHAPGDSLDEPSRVAQAHEVPE